MVYRILLGIGLVNLAFEHPLLVALCAIGTFLYENSTQEEVKTLVELGQKVLSGSTWVKDFINNYRKLEDIVDEFNETPQPQEIEYSMPNSDFLKEKLEEFQSNEPSEMLNSVISGGEYTDYLDCSADVVIEELVYGDYGDERINKLAGNEDFQYVLKSFEEQYNNETNALAKLELIEFLKRQTTKALKNVFETKWVPCYLTTVLNDEEQELIKGLLPDIDLNSKLTEKDFRIFSKSLKATNRNTDSSVKDEQLEETIEDILFGITIVMEKPVNNPYKIQRRI